MKRYKIIATGTEDMGTTGDQQYLGRVGVLEPQIMNGYCHNVVVSIQNNKINTTTDGIRPNPSYTIYLSKAGATGAGGGGWNEDDVIDAKATPAGGGTVSLTAKRYIKTNAFGSTNAEDIGPVHIWAEATDVPGTENEARITMQAWGYFHTLTSDLA